MASTTKSRHMIIYVAGVLWCIGIFVCLAQSYQKLGTVDENIRATYNTTSIATGLVNAVADTTSTCTAEVKDGKLVDTTGAGANNGTCYTCKEAFKVVNEVFFHGEDEEYVFGTRQVGHLYRKLFEHADKNNNTCSAALRKIRDEVNGIGSVATELWVLEKTRMAVLISVILAGVAVLVVVGSETIGRWSGGNVRIDGHLLHWVYTLFIFVSVFLYVVAFTVSFTREFWISTWHVVGADVTFGSDGAPNHKHFDADDHTNIMGYMVAGLVFQLAAFAAHFTIKYGPLVHFTQDIEEEFTQGIIRRDRTDGLASKAATKVQYAPLVSVARRA